MLVRDARIEDARTESAPKLRGPSDGGCLVGTANYIRLPTGPL